MRSKTSNNGPKFRYKHIINCIIFIAFNLFWNFEDSIAQHRITSNDEFIIKRKAVGLVKELAYKYNQLLEADSEDRKLIIDNMILPTDGNISTFVSDQVIIEDDFQTRANFASDKPSKRVDIYFQEICANYGKQDNGEYKNEGKTIAINNIRSSKIMAVSDNTPLFIKVFYDVSYTGNDIRTGIQFKQPCSRVAEIQATKDRNIWSISILTMRFLKESELDFSKNVLIEKVSITPDLQATLVEGEKKTINRNPYLQSFKNDDKWGIRNLDDNDKILIMPTFDEIEDFSEDGLALVNIGGLWGYIDLTGKLIINCEYDNAESFSKEKKGKAKVQKGMQFFFIDKSGNRVR